MNRLVVAMEGERQRAQILAVCQGGGIPVRYVTDNAPETVRMIRKMGGGVVVCGFKMGNQTAEELAYQLAGLAQILVVATPDRLEYLEDTDLFRLSVPFSRGELIAAIRILLQMEQQNLRRTLPKRDNQEENTVRQAKEWMMQKYDIDEATAHHMLQRRSMNAGRKLAEEARIILTMEDETL